MVGKLTALDRRHRRADRRRSGPSCAGGSPPCPGCNRFLRVTPKGLLRIDKAKIASRGEPGREVPAALLGPAPVRRGHRAGLQAVAAGRTRLAGHEDHPGTAAGLPPARRPHPRPRHPLLARAAAGPDRRDHHRRHLEPASARTCRNCTSARSKAPPARSGSAPSSPPPSATSSPSWASTHPRRSSNSGRHRQRPDQHEHHRLDTRLSRRLPAFPQVKPQIPCPAPTSAAEPGEDAAVVAARPREVAGGAVRGGQVDGSCGQITLSHELRSAQRLGTRRTAGCRYPSTAYGPVTPGDPPSPAAEEVRDHV